MVLAQGFSIAADGSLTLPDDRAIRMEIPADLAPICPNDGRMMTTNLRVDARFVQDAGWYAASRRYELFLEKRRMAKTLYWELGIGYNTPGIIKYAFWRRTAANPNAVYCCLNLGEASAPEEIVPRSICIDRDIREVDGESIILRIDPLLYAPPRSGAFFFFGFGTAVTGRSARTTAAASPGLSTSRI